jgi:hypothetical protein
MNPIDAPRSEDFDRRVAAALDRLTDAIHRDAARKDATVAANPFDDLAQTMASLAA